MKYAYIIILLLTLFNCKNKSTKEAQLVETIITSDFELHKHIESNKLLILYPGGATTSKQTKEEFDILEPAKENNVSVLLSNFNKHLWMDSMTIDQQIQVIKSAIEKYNMSHYDIYIGGMSIGGNVSLTIANHLITEKSSISPKGVFVVDSPIDLYALYKTAKNDLFNPDFSEQRLAEPKWIINYFEKNFGKNDELVQHIQAASPFVFQIDYIAVPQLRNCKLRFYTEPDSLWWLENRQTAYEYTNAYAIQQIATSLNDKKWDSFELIETKNKGYRANGDRHPHSWSIVDTEELIEWMQ